MDDRDRDLKINSLEINQNTMAENIKTLKDDVKLGFEKTDKSFDEIKILIKEVSNSKANKWVESFILWVGAIVGAGFLGYLGNLVYKATINFK